MSKKKIIYSASEAADNEFEHGEKGGFWSNELGWTIKTYATRFSKAESKIFSLPLSRAGDAEWVDFSL